MSSTLKFQVRRIKVEQAEGKDQITAIGPKQKQIMADEDAWNDEYTDRVMQAIKNPFTNHVNPTEFLLHLNTIKGRILSKQQMETINTVTTNSGPMIGAQKLLDIMMSKPFGFQTIVNTLNVEDFCSSHHAKELMTLKDQVDKSIVQRYSMTGFPTESRLIQIQQQWANMRMKMKKFELLVEDRVSSWDSRLNGLQDKVMDIEKKITENVHEESSMRQEIDDIKKNLKDTETKQREMIQETSHVKETLQLSADELENLQGVVHTLEQSDVKAKCFVSEMNVFRSNSVKEQQTLETSVDKVKEETESMKEKVNKVETTVNGIDHGLVSVKANIASTTQAMEKLKEEHQNKIDHLASEVKDQEIVKKVALIDDHIRAVDKKVESLQEVVEGWEMPTKDSEEGTNNDTAVQNTPRNISRGDHIDGASEAFSELKRIVHKNKDLSFHSKVKVLFEAEMEADIKVNGYLNSKTVHHNVDGIWNKKNKNLIMPTPGTYRFEYSAKQLGDGKVAMCLCEKKKEDKGVTFANSSSSTNLATLTAQCDRRYIAGVRVWFRAWSQEGNPNISDCHFSCMRLTLQDAI